jgi:signal peptidase I
VRVRRAVGIGLAGLLLTVPILAIVLALVLVPLTLTGVTHLYRAPTSVMEPTLFRRDRIFAVKYLFSNPERGDIIAFHRPPRVPGLCGPGDVVVKRVIGLPGETVTEDEGFVSIDGKPLGEPYLDRERRGTGNFTVDVPEGRYFVIADNRTGDPCIWRPIPRANIIGRVIATYWPPSRIALH